MIPKNLEKIVTKSQVGNQSLQFQRVRYSDTDTVVNPRVEAPQIFKKQDKLLGNKQNLETEKHRYFLQSMVQRAETLARPVEAAHSVSRLERAQSIDWIHSKTLGLGGYFPMRNIVKQSYKAFSRGIDNSLYLSKEVMMKQPVQEDRISIQKEKRSDSCQRQLKSMSNLLSRTTKEELSAFRVVFLEAQPGKQRQTVRPRPQTLTGDKSPEPQQVSRLGWHPKLNNRQVWRVRLLQHKPRPS